MEFSYFKLYALLKKSWGVLLRKTKLLFKVRGKVVGFFLGFLIILLFRNSIICSWTRIIGLPLFGNVKSSIVDDWICLAILISSFFLIKKSKEKSHIPFDVIVFLIIAFYVLYYYQRICFPDTFIPFYSFSYIVYADILPVILLFYIISNFRMESKCKRQEIYLSNDIDSKVQEYLSCDNEQYAIMLTGEYGAGKTFYYNHTIKRFVQAQNKESIYISVYGVKSQEDLHKKFIEEIYPIIKGNFFYLFTGILEALSNFIGRNINVDKSKITKSININWSNYVVCVDDLERIAKESCITEIFAYIDEILVNHKVKIIFIGNEERLNSLDNNKDYDSEYKRNKEKLVRYTYRYTCDIRCFIKTCINKEENTEFSEYLNSVIDRIEYFYKSRSCNNLRTVQFNIFVLKYIYQYLQKKDISKYLHKIMDDYYLFLTMVYSLEYKIHNNLSIFEKMNVNEVKTALRRKYYQSFLYGRDSDYKKEAYDMTEEASVVDKYWGVNYHDYRVSLPLIAYIHTGIFDLEKFRVEVDSLIVKYQKEEITHEQNLLNSLNNAWDKEDIEMENIVNESLTKLEYGEFELKNYPLFVHRLSFLDENRFIDIGIQNETVKNKIRKGMNIRMKKEPNCLDDDMENYCNIYGPQLKYNAFYEEIKKTVVNFCKENKENFLKHKFSKEFRFFNQDFNFEEYTEYNCDLFEGQISVEEFFVILYKADNKGKMIITNLIRNRLKYNSCLDKEFYEQLKIKLEEYLEKETKALVSRKNMELLLKILKGEID